MYVPHISWPVLLVASAASTARCTLNSRGSELCVNCFICLHCPAPFTNWNRWSCIDREKASSDHWLVWTLIWALSLISHVMLGKLLYFSKPQFLFSPKRDMTVLFWGGGVLNEINSKWLVAQLVTISTRWERTYLTYNPSGVWDGHVYIAMFKMDNQQGPTV